MASKKSTDTTAVNGRANKRPHGALMKNPAAAHAGAITVQTGRLKVSRDQVRRQAATDSAERPDGRRRPDLGAGQTCTVPVRMEVLCRDAMRSELMLPTLRVVVDHATSLAVGATVMRDLPLDIGRDMPASGLMAALADRGVQVHFRSPHNPYAKYDVERVFRSPRGRLKSLSRGPQAIRPKA